LSSPTTGWADMLRENSTPETSVNKNVNIFFMILMFRIPKI
jgi:hypothetical protein